ncbi:unnamed protein product, partial [Didymodactylos carnosus]
MTMAFSFLEAIHEHDHEHDDHHHNDHNHHDLSKMVEKQNEDKAFLTNELNEGGSGSGPGRGTDSGSGLLDGERNDSHLGGKLSIINGPTRSPKPPKHSRLPVLLSRNSSKGNSDGGENVGSASAASKIGGQGTVVATLSNHAATKPANSMINTSVPVIILPKNDTTNSSRTSSAKQFLMKRVRSHSRSDPPPVPDKSLFSRLFMRKSRRGDERHRISNPANVHIQKDNEYDEALTLSDTNVSMRSLVNTGKTASSDQLTDIQNEDKLAPVSHPQYYTSMAAGDTGSWVTYHKHIQTLELPHNKSDKLQTPSSLR